MGGEKESGARAGGKGEHGERVSRVREDDQEGNLGIEGEIVPGGTARRSHGLPSAPQPPIPMPPILNPAKARVPWSRALVSCGPNEKRGGEFPPFAYVDRPGQTTAHDTVNGLIVTAVYSNILF